MSNFILFFYLSFINNCNLTKANIINKKYIKKNMIVLYLEDFCVYN